MIPRRVLAACRFVVGKPLLYLGLRLLRGRRMGCSQFAGFPRIGSGGLLYGMSLAVVPLTRRLISSK